MTVDALHERIKMLEELLEFKRTEIYELRSNLRIADATICALRAQIPEQVSLSFVLYGMLREPGHIPQYRNIVAACFPDWTPDHVNQFIDSALIANGAYKT